MQGLVAAVAHIYGARLVVLALRIPRFPKDFILLLCPVRDAVSGHSYSVQGRFRVFPDTCGMRELL